MKISDRQALEMIENIGDYPKIKIELTKEQAQAMLSLIDIAVKAGGLTVASTAVFFHNLLEQAAKVSELTPPEKMAQTEGLDAEPVK